MGEFLKQLWAALRNLLRDERTDEDQFEDRHW
jgi:hypothetical protein